MHTSTSLASKASDQVMITWLVPDKGQRYAGAVIPKLGSRDRTGPLAGLVVFLPRNSIGTIHMSTA
jgi:hypothetical protein